MVGTTDQASGDQIKALAAEVASLKQTITELKTVIRVLRADLDELRLRQAVPPK
jgi:hypothetical protein